MKSVINILTITYIISAVLLAVYASGTIVLLARWWSQRHPEAEAPSPPEDAWPSVLVQLPVYNERVVIGRLIAAAAALAYPADRLHIQVLDDSTDETRDLVARLVAQLARQGVHITHVQRASRTGFKAGALQAGLAAADAELVAVFDADFVPAPDFLRRVVPHFMADARLGMVQTRWGHLNADENWITRAQRLSLDGHFVVEQMARSRSGLLLNFSGSAGVWRAACIADAGNWSSRTLAEDLDLSYRAQLKGWKFLYLPEVVVPAEIPPQITAYRVQQARWAKGSTQNLLLHMRSLWTSAYLTNRQKVMGTLHLGQYVVHPLMLLLLLLTPPLLATGTLEGLPLAPLGIAGIGPPLLYALSQQHLRGGWLRRMLAFPVLIGIGTGLALSNTLAVLAALRGEPNVFRRTPKFDGQAWQRSPYALGQGGFFIGEGLLFVYAAAGAWLAFEHALSLVPFLLVYAFAFGLVACLTLGEWVQLRRNAPPRRAAQDYVSVQAGR